MTENAPAIKTGAESRSLDYGLKSSFGTTDKNQITTETAGSLEETN